MNRIRITKSEITINFYYFVIFILTVIQQTKKINGYYWQQGARPFQGWLQVTVHLGLKVT